MVAVTAPTLTLPPAAVAVAVRLLSEVPAIIAPTVVRAEPLLVIVTSVNTEAVADAPSIAPTVRAPAPVASVIVTVASFASAVTAPTETAPAPPVTDKDVSAAAPTAPSIKAPEVLVVDKDVSAAAVTAPISRAAVVLVVVIDVPAAIATVPSVKAEVVDATVRLVALAATTLPVRAAYSTVPESPVIVTLVALFIVVEARVADSD
jgi:hypothetical protein